MKILSFAVATLVSSAAVLAPAHAQPAAGAPDALVRQISTDVIDSVKSDKTIQSGDISKILDRKSVV